MAQEIKLFQSFIKINQTLGIYPTQLKQFAFLLPVVLVFISSASYSIIKARTIAEYAQGFWLYMAALCCLIHSLTMRWKMGHGLYFIEKVEKFIKKSAFPDTCVDFKTN